MTYFTPEEITPRQSVIMFLKMAAHSMNDKSHVIDNHNTQSVFAN